MKKQFNITSTVEQGMSIDAVSLFLSESDEVGVLKIRTLEEGFTDPWIFTVYLNRSKIEWKDGHYWVRKFFNAEVTRKILQFVNEYFDDLPF